MSSTHAPPSRLPVAVLGATGAVGQRLVTMLADHPWFEVVALTASERSAGRPYGEVVPWVLDAPLPARLAQLEVRATEPGPAVALAFSALDAEFAGPAEEAFARAGALVVTNARPHRLDADVPLVVPEVNADHLALLERQREERRFDSGGIVTVPNCSAAGLALALAPLHREWGVRKVHVVTLQALSGAGLVEGRWLALEDDLIPFIEGEEEKLAGETPKLLGALRGDEVVPADLALSASCNRVPVSDGHVQCISVELARPADAAELRAAWESFRGAPQELGLPSAPARPVVWHDAPDAPRPGAHRDEQGGMAAHVGRLRPCPLLDWRFVTLSHNTLRGAAGGAVLLAELCVARESRDSA